MTKVIPEYVYLFEILREYQVSKNSFESESNWREELVETKREIHELKSRIADINLQIPSERELSIPSRFLDSLRIKNGISLERLEIVSTDSTKQYKFIRFKVIFKSPFNNIKFFIQEIEKDVLLIAIESFKIKLPTLFYRQVETELILDILLQRNDT